MELFSLLAKLTLDKSEYEKSLDEAQKDANAFEMPEEPELTLDADGFSEGVSNAREQGKDFGSVMEGVFDGIKTALTVTGVVAAVSGIVGYLKEGVNLAMQLGDDVDKGSKRLNISTTAYQEWQHALSQSGANINDLNRGIRTMNKLLTSGDPGAVLKDAADAADGMADTVSKDAAQAFARLGISEKVANGELKTTEELMEATLIALAGFKGSKEERGTLVTALFGPNGNNLNALLDEGQDGVEELLAEAGKLGLVMSEEEIANSVKLGDDIANLKEELKHIQIAFVQHILPIIDNAVEGLTNFLVKLNPRLQKNSITDIFDEIDRKAIASGKQLDNTRDSAQAMIDKLAGMGDYWVLDEQGQVTWNTLAEEFVTKYPQFAKYIDLEKKKITENTDAIKENIREWVNRQKQQLIDTAFAEKRDKIAQQYADAMYKEAEAESKSTEAEAKRASVINDYNALLEEQIKKREQLAQEADRNLNKTEADYYRNEADKFRALLLSEDSDYTEFMQNRANVQLLLGDDYSTQGLFGKIGTEWQEILNEANSLHDESTKLMQEADEAQESLERDQESLTKIIYGTQEEVKKTKNEIDLYVSSLNNIPSDVWTTLHLDEDRGFGRAIGDRYIPYDNFPALLHRGERVLTATEARRERESDNISTNLENRIIAAIREGMAGAQVEAVVTDRELARGTNRFNGKEIDSGRFLP